MYFMGDESSNGPWNSHEGISKNPLKCLTHTSTKVDVNALEKCCTHLLISNSSCQICLKLGQQSSWWHILMQKKNLCD